jgi:hypothetical protein
MIASIFFMTLKFVSARTTVPDRPRTRRTAAFQANPTSLPPLATAVPRHETGEAEATKPLVLQRFGAGELFFTQEVADS